jgi:hypothetical protein
MKGRKRVTTLTPRAALFGVSLALLAGFEGGCAGDEDTTGSNRAGVRGEACQSTRDCEGGLACVGGICSVRTFSLTVTQKECVRIQCRTVADCMPSYCEDYETACADGDAYTCDLFDTQCEWACESERCQKLCDTDSQCSGDACVSGRCTPIGCESHSECRILLQVQGSEDAECRPK